MMKMTKSLWFGLIGLALLICPVGVGAKQDKKKDREEASLWMTKKLEFSKHILTGLTRGDFELIRKNADALQVVGYLNQWDRAHLPEYRRQVTYFDESLKELIRQAGKKNINGAALAYTQVTLSCVQCHNVIRDANAKKKK